MLFRQEGRESENVRKCRNKNHCGPTLRITIVFVIIYYTQDGEAAQSRDYTIEWYDFREVCMDICNSYKPKN